MMFRTTNQTTFATRLLTAVAGLLLVAAAGCGDSDDGDDGSNDSNGSNNSSSEYSCCLNGSFYECPSSDALETCDLDGPGDCTRDSSRDGECDGNGGGGGGNNNDDGGGTSGNDVGDPCNTNSECNNNICIVENSGDNVGYCSKPCDSFSDCPSFWDCEEVGAATGTYCVDNS